MSALQKDPSCTKLTSLSKSSGMNLTHTPALTFKEAELTDGKQTSRMEKVLSNT